MSARKVILYIAMSLDGYITRQNNDISWLSIVENPDEDYGYAKFVQDVDTVIMGRKTYEKVISFGIDEFVISIIPIFLGNGIRLFKDGSPEQRLELISSKGFKTGLVHLWYQKTKH